MVQITRQELVSMLKAIKGARAATFVYESAPKMLVKSKIDKVANPFRDDVIKHRVHNVMLNFDYTNSVNRQRAREGKEDAGEFVAQAGWGEHTGDNRIIVELHGREYIQVKLQKVIKTEYRQISNGSMIDAATLSEFFSTRKPSSNQGVDRAVDVLKIKVDNVLEFRHAGEVYEIID